jgi:hypothetical protein
MTRLDRNFTPAVVDVAAPGNAHLIDCHCGHPPDEHDTDVGCLHDWDFGEGCDCPAYQVRK